MRFRRFHSGTVFSFRLDLMFLGDWIRNGRSIWCYEIYTYEIHRLLPFWLDLTFCLIDWKFCFWCIIMVNCIAANVHCSARDSIWIPFKSFLWWGRYLGFSFSFPLPENFPLWFYVIDLILRRKKVNKMLKQNFYKQMFLICKCIPVFLECNRKFPLRGEMTNIWLSPCDYDYDFLHSFLEENRNYRQQLGCHFSHSWKLVRSVIKFYVRQKL